MATQSLPYVTPEQYLEFDRKSEFKNEYMYGEIVCMAGGTAQHGLIGANAIAELHFRLAGGSCRVYTSDVRVSLNPKQGYVYPDITVVSGATEYRDGNKDTIANPKLAIEVLSPTTRNKDLGDKARLYWETPSLTNLIFIEQERIWIEHWHRATDGDWKKTVLKDAAGILTLESLNCEIPVARLYLGVDLPSTAE